MDCSTRTAHDSSLKSQIAVGKPNGGIARMELLKAILVGFGLIGFILLLRVSREQTVVLNEIWKLAKSLSLVGVG